MSARYILTLACPDVLGIVHAVSGFLTIQRCNILESAQHRDDRTGRFFMRVEFSPHGTTPPLEGLRAGFAPIADQYAMAWAISDAAAPCRTLILVSQQGHCLHELLYRVQLGVLPIQVAGVVSNHQTFSDLAASHGAPFHHLPIDAQTKPAQEARLLELVSETGAELIVLARYMQILSAQAAGALAGRCINIHHSFLPSFKGARPYHAAHARGVKLIGATAHYVTADLDEGPIIEQEVQRVSHRHTADDLVAVGRDIERQVLARAVQAHVERRVFLNGATTVVF
jgi:formyltetrahydrofolate deformylase